MKKHPLGLRARFSKRLFDIILSAASLIVFGWIILIAYIIASIDTRTSGLFTQTRIGKDGKPFKILKIRTMKKSNENKTTVTTRNDTRITLSGKFLRSLKIDELPQLFNVLVGHMSFVGPRPDVPGFADKLEGEDRIILCIRPGITGPASIEFKNEEALLANVEDPEKFNREVIWPRKVAINKSYIHNYKISKDLLYIWRTAFKERNAPC